MLCRSSQVSEMVSAPSVRAPEQSSPVRKRKKSEVKYLTEPEIDLLLSAMRDNLKPWFRARDYAMFLVCYQRGLRASELGNLQLADYLARDDRLIIRRLKGSKGGEYHLTKREVNALKLWLRERGHEPGPLFPSRNGTGISQQMLDVLMKRYGLQAGIPAGKCHTHALKHSCGTHLLNLGESIEDVQDHLGHRQIANTLIYADYTNKRRIERDRRLRNW